MARLVVSMLRLFAGEMRKTTDVHTSIVAVSTASIRLFSSKVHQLGANACIKITLVIGAASYQLPLVSKKCVAISSDKLANVIYDVADLPTKTPTDPKREVDPDVAMEPETRVPSGFLTTTGNIAITASKFRGTDNLMCSSNPWNP